MADPELRLSDFAAADDATSGRLRLWLATRKGDEGHEDDRPCLLVLAYCARQARLFAAAAEFDSDDEDARAEAGWVASDTGYVGTATATPIPKRVLGVWAAPDAVWAACGIEPNEDWRMCGCCGEVLLVEERWTNDGDECDDCTETVDDDDGPDPITDEGLPGPRGGRRG